MTCDDQSRGAEAPVSRPDPQSPDAAAAHQFLSELRTRISTQPLPYQHGVESRALESLWEVFGQARAAMKDHPGCEEFARETTRMLNMDLRPVTAKWHRAHAEGRLNSRDGANEFRADLEAARRRLREFAARLHVMAYGSEQLDDETPDAMPPDEIDLLFEPLRSGIPVENGLIGPELARSINKTESEAIARRREHYGIPEDREDAVGLGLSAAASARPPSASAWSRSWPRRSSSGMWTSSPRSRAAAISAPSCQRRSQMRGARSASPPRAAPTPGRSAT